VEGKSRLGGANNYTPPFCSTELQEEGVGYTDKKEIKIFLIYKEIRVGADAKSYMRKGFLKKYEEMRKYIVISEEAVSHI
jgi:hypothetical protein